MKKVMDPAGRKSMDPTRSGYRQNSVPLHLVSCNKKDTRITLTYSINMKYYDFYNL